MGTVLLVDAYNVFFRNFCANPTMGVNGNHIGGTSGFLKSLTLTAEMVRPSRCYVVWDGGNGSSRRRAILPTYKSQRRPQSLNRQYDGDIPNTVEDVSSQVEATVNILNFAPVVQSYVDDCEADDVIAYLVNFEHRDDSCVIVSSDKDFYQLASKRVRQWTPGRKIYITPDVIAREFGVLAENFLLMRTMIGDPSDCIRGISRVGCKTAVKRFPCLAERPVMIDDIMDECRSRILAGDHAEFYDSILRSEDLMRVNWRLMCLDGGQLSASHIDKIKAVVERGPTCRNKLSMIRSALRFGMNNVDLDRTYAALSCAS